MASQLHMKFNLTAREELDAGSSQTHSVIDSVAQRRWGGEVTSPYTSHVTDGSSKIVIHESAKAALAAAIQNTELHRATFYNTNHPSYVTRGQQPSTTLNTIAIECIEAAGTGEYLELYIEDGNEVFLRLYEGESVVLPVYDPDHHIGQIFRLIADVADNDTDFVRFNILLAGT